VRDIGTANQDNRGVAITDNAYLLRNEFGAVLLSIDRRGRSERLGVVNLESGDVALLDALDLASFCLADDEQRAEWLRVGVYRTGRGAGGPPT
jgi:hypothetical protein